MQSLVAPSFAHFAKGGSDTSAQVKDSAVHQLEGDLPVAPSFAHFAKGGSDACVKIICP